MDNIRIKEVENSSNILGLKYIVDTKSLEVTFTSGQVYRYDDVPEDVADLMFNAESVGKTFFAAIKGKFNFTKLS
jgi:heme/copper-type cytochrome/quinol oxidase subunit 3